MKRQHLRVLKMTYAIQTIYDPSNWHDCILSLWWRTKQMLENGICVTFARAQAKSEEQCNNSLSHMAIREEL
jgi:hypothetical protein